MSKPDATDEHLLGTYPQQTKNYLSIYQPDVILSCQVSGTYNRTNQEVGYDNVTAGSYLNIETDLFRVVLVGTAPGLEDVGRTWIRSADASLLKLVESDHVPWQDNLYITVLGYTEIIPTFPRIIKNPANEEDVIFYKWWDLAYEQQNEQLGTIICMGSHYAGFDRQIFWSASGTENLLGNDVTYLWEFEGSTSTGSSAHTPGWIDYPNPGYFETRLTVFGSNGSADRSIRYISLYDRPGQGPNMPYLNWTRTEFGGTQDGHGYSCRIKLYDPVPNTVVLEGALVTIFKDDWYGDIQQSVHNNGLGRERVSMVGYIESGTIQYNYADGSIEFNVISPTNIMEICEGFSISVESSKHPTTWYELLNMTVKRAIYHYLKWQSTVLLCTDVQFLFQDRDVQYFDADRTSLFDAIYQFFNGCMYGNIVSDRLGKIWLFQDVAAHDEATNPLPVALDIQKSSWAGQPNISERHYSDTCFIELGGIAYVASTGQSTALLASAPGLSPGYHGRVDKKQGLALINQAELDRIVGNLYAFRNSRYPDVQLSLRGNFSNLDIAPPEVVLLTVASADTPRQITWTRKPFAVTGISWNWDAKAQVERPTLTLAEVTQGASGSTISIPITPPTSTPGNGNYQQPPITTPTTPMPYPTMSGSLTGIRVYDEHIFLDEVDTFDFVGTGVTASVSGSTAYIYVPGLTGSSGGGGGLPSGTIIAGSYYGQISFGFEGTSADTDGTCINSEPTKIYRTVQYDVGSFFSNTGVTMTFPVTGMYQISLYCVASILIYPLETTTFKLGAEIEDTDEVYTNGQQIYSPGVNGSSVYEAFNPTIMFMIHKNAASTLNVRLSVMWTGGTTDTTLDSWSGDVIIAVNLLAKD